MLELIVKYRRIAKCLNGNFSKRLIPVSALIIVLLLAISSCKDSLGIDSNGIKTALKGDTIRIDTTFINFKKVIIREIVRQNDTLTDTVFVGTKLQLSYGRIKEFNLTVNYLYYQNQISNYQLKISSFSDLKDTNQLAVVEYNGYQPIFSIDFSGIVNYNGQLYFDSYLDTLSRFDFSFKQIQFWDLIGTGNLNRYFSSGSKADLWFKPQGMTENDYNAGSTNFQMAATSLTTDSSGSGKIKSIRLNYDGQFIMPADSVKIEYNGFFNVVFN